MARAAVIREAVVPDVPAIAELGMELMDFHQQLDRFYSRSADGPEFFAKFVEENIESEDCCVLVAEVEGKVVGYCQGKRDEHPPVLKEPEYGAILVLAVTENYRRTGIGRALVQAMLDWFCERGLRRIEVRHSTRNEMAARFWSEMGFRPYLKTLFMEIHGDKGQG